VSPSASGKSTIDRILDAGVFAPIGFLVTRDAKSGELAKAGRKQVAFARSLGRAALKGVSRGIRPSQAMSVATPTAPATPTVETPAPATPIGVEGYSEMLARDIITMVRTGTPEQAEWIKAQETAGKKRVTVLRAAQARLDERS
jgi:hypothetical protein